MVFQFEPLTFQNKLPFMKRKMLLLTLAIPVILCQNAQAQSSRLTAKSDYSSNGAIFSVLDSTAYTYSDGRGGDLNHQLKYDTATTWDYSGLIGGYNDSFNYIQTFDASNNLLSTITQYWSGTAWINWTNVLYTYNTNGSLATTTWQNWGGATWTNLNQNTYTYNTAGQLYLTMNNIWNSLTAGFTIQNTESIFTYDALGNVSSEIDESWNAGSSLYVYTDEILYTDTANEVLTTQYNTWNGAGWTNGNLTTNTYDANGDLLTQLYQTYNGSAWVNQTLQVYSNFTSPGSNLPMTQINQVWDTTGGGTFDNVMMYTYTYNSYGQMTESTGESWNPGVGWEFANGNPQAFYYYGPYTPAVTSVKNVVNNGGEANIYPVPAQSTLNIELTWTVPQTATIAIYDITGRQLNTLTAPMGTQFNGTLSVSNLADGMYVIRIDGTQGQIVKQIVVAH